MAASEGEGGSSPSRKGLILGDGRSSALPSASTVMFAETSTIASTSCGADISNYRMPKFPTGCARNGPHLPPKLARHQSMIPARSFAVPSA